MINDVVKENYTLLHGDCLERMKEIPDESVDLIITSPPYYNAREYSQYSSYQEYLKTMVSVFSAVSEKMNSGSFMCINISPVIQARGSRSEKSKRYAIPQNLTTELEKIGLEFIDEIIWVKPEGAVKNRGGGFFRSRKPKAYKPNCVTESILVFQRDDSGIIDKHLKNEDLVEDGYERSNVWLMNPETKSKHSAPFPVELPDKLIRYYSYSNQIVLDPFMGSGTTGVACLNTNRKFIGIEMDEGYFNIAVERINMIVNQPYQLGINP